MQNNKQQFCINFGDCGSLVFLIYQQTIGCFVLVQYPIYQFAIDNIIMNKDHIASSIVPNLYQLKEIPFLKREVIPWRRFKDKERYLPLLRSITYQCKDSMSKMFLFELKEDKKDNKIKRALALLTEKEIIGLDGLYQILNQNIKHQQFSVQVSKIKQFEQQVYNYITAAMQKNLISFGKGTKFLNFNVYMKDSDFYIKASFNTYKFHIQMCENNLILKPPSQLKVTNYLVKQQLTKIYHSLLKMTATLPINDEIGRCYRQFYDTAYFLYDQYMLKLQVYHNYPMLRMKNYIPVRFKDFKTDQPLEGPIFSNSDTECMYGHFSGYNADSTKLVQGEACQICQIQVDQLQQNDLLMMLRDNILNPQRRDVFFCPQYNRFKLIGKIAVAVDKQTNGQMNEQTVIYKTTLDFLNYYHFRLNLKKMTNKNRVTFYPSQIEEMFPLTFNYIDRQLLIMDPARGKYCQHYSFSDLRLYYCGYDAQTNLYSCPIEGCDQKMNDSDILYLKEVTVLLEYVKFKCQKCVDLVTCSKILIDHKSKKLCVSYKYRQQNGGVSGKLQELVDFYKTLVDPFIPFSEYSLGIKQKQRQQKLQEYMFGGLRGEMQEQIQEQSDQDQDNA